MFISSDIAPTRQRTCTHDVFKYRGLEYFTDKNSAGYAQNGVFDVYYCDHCLGIVAIPRQIERYSINMMRATHNQELAEIVGRGQV